MNSLKLSTLISAIVIVTLSSCKDDDYSQQLEYTICINEIVHEDNRLSQQNIELAGWPNEIRSYFTTEFSGFAISTVQSFKDVDDTKYYLLEATNGGQLLFDDLFNFICGDETFKKASGKNDEKLDPTKLPQKILDYIEANYSGIGIDKAELEDGKYEIELKNGLELCFDLTGNFEGEC